MAGAKVFENAKRYIVEDWQADASSQDHEIFALDQVVEAYQYLASNEQIGEVVTTVPRADARGLWALLHTCGVPFPLLGEVQ